MQPVRCACARELPAELLPGCLSIPLTGSQDLYHHNSIGLLLLLLQQSQTVAATTPQTPSCCSNPPPTAPAQNLKFIFTPAFCSSLGCALLPGRGTAASSTSSVLQAAQRHTPQDAAAATKGSTQYAQCAAAFGEALQQAHLADAAGMGSCTFDRLHARPAQTWLPIAAARPAFTPSLLLSTNRHPTHARNQARGTHSPCCALYVRLAAITLLRRLASVATFQPWTGFSL